jgi:integrase
VGSRGGIFYFDDANTKSRKSLRTTDEDEAERLIHAINEAECQPSVTRKVGLANLSAADPEYAKRTWKFVMSDIIKDKKGATLRRYLTALKDEAYKLIEGKLLVETLACDFKEVLRVGTVSTNVYLRRFQNHALDMGWLPVPVLPKKKFDEIEHKDSRALTWSEHRKIIERETNPERRDFYELCWHFGASQSDVASLKSEDLDFERRCFVYNRMKTGNMGGMHIGDGASKNKIPLGSLPPSACNFLEFLRN